MSLLSSNSILSKESTYQVGKYLFCSKLTIKPLELCLWTLFSCFYCRSWTGDSSLKRICFFIYILDDLAEVFSWRNWFSFQAILNASVSVDTFFFLRLVSENNHVTQLIFTFWKSEVGIPEQCGNNVWS